MVLIILFGIILTGSAISLFVHVRNYALQRHVDLVREANKIIDDESRRWNVLPEFDKINNQVADHPRRSPTELGIYND